MSWLRVAVFALGLLTLGFVTDAAAQWEITGKAALPAVPHWIPVSRDRGTDALPLLWFNEVDGNSDGCCVVGAAGRAALPSGSLWFGLGFGTDPDGGSPAAIEAAVELAGGAVGFRDLHGRIGFAGLYPVYTSAAANRREPDRISVGVAAVWLDDPRYLETVTFFDCPEAAPSAPCDEVDTPYTWSDGRDHSVLAEAAWGRGDWRQPRLNGSLMTGLKVAGGEHAYVRGEAEAYVTNRLSPAARLDVRLAGGWASGGAPQQRRFLLQGADPVTRWLNPYIEARGALFEGVPYHVPGGPDLRVYEYTRPLVKKYLAASGRVSTDAETETGLWARFAAYLAAAWTPGIPDRMGREQMNDDGDLLFDWRALPDGQGEEQGQFRAGVLEVSQLWTDAGLEVTGGFRNVAVTISLPLWASQPAFARESILDDERSAFGFRWTLSFAFFPMGRPEIDR